MPRLLIKRVGRGLEPVDAVSEEYIKKWGEGEVRVCEVKKVRNPQHHRKAFAVLAFAHDNQEVYPSVEALLEAVKVATGHFDELRFGPDKPVFYKTKSISFGNMSQDDFGDFYIRMLDALEEITGIPAQILEEGGRESS